jgi:hypothetical protein
MTITVRVPMTFVRRGGRKVIVAPDGGDAWAPTKHRLDETLIRAVARAHRWKRMLEEGKFRSATEIAEAEGRHPQLRQPPAAADAAGAGYRRSHPQRTTGESDAARRFDPGAAERMARAEATSARAIGGASGICRHGAGPSRSTARTSLETKEL